MQLNENFSPNMEIFTSKELLGMIHLTKQYLQSFHNDQDVCIRLLEGIQIYIKACSLMENDDTLEEVRLTSVKMIEIFL